VARYEGPAGPIWEALDAACRAASERLTRGGWGLVNDAEALACHAACSLLRDAGGSLPEAWEPLLAALVRWDSRDALPGLALLPPTRRDDLLLDALLTRTMSNRSQLQIAFPSPRLVAAVVDQVLGEEGWRYREIALAIEAVGPELVRRLRAMPDLLSWPGSDVSRAWAIAEIVAHRPGPEALPLLLLLLDVPSPPQDRLAPWVARRWGRLPDELLAGGLGLLAGPLAAQPLHLQPRWVEIVEGAARLPAARALAAAWAREPVAPALQRRLAWVAAPEPPALVSLREGQNPEDRGLRAWVVGVSGEENVGGQSMEPFLDHPALAWAVVRWVGAEAPLAALRQAKVDPAAAQPAVRAWLERWLDGLGAGVPLPTPLEGAFVAAVGLLGADSGLAALLARVLGAVVAQPSLLALVDAEVASAAQGWPVGEARELLQSALAARRDAKGKKAALRTLEGALAAVETRVERLALPERWSGPCPAWQDRGGKVEALPGQLGGPITRLEAQQDLWLAVGGGRAMVGDAIRVRWQAPTDTWAVLGADGDQVWMVEEERARGLSLDHPETPAVELLPEDGFHALLSLPGHRVLTLCAAHTTNHPAQIWDAVRGEVTLSLKTADMPLAARLLPGDAVLLLGVQSVEIWAPGEKKPARWRTSDGVLWSAACAGRIAVGLEGGKLALLRWSAGKLKEEAAHEQAWHADWPGMAGDPGGPWWVQPHPDGLQVWSEGQPAGWIAWPGLDSAAHGLLVAGDLAWVSRGARVEAWDLPSRRRLVGWEAPAPITSLIGSGKSLWLGDQQGKIWRLTPGPRTLSAARG
jgi:hypothetical protein